MKIIDVKTFKWNPGSGKNFLYVKLLTDNGLVGWGEAYTQSDRDVQIEAHILELSRYLIDRDPFQIKHFMHVAHEDFATKRSSMDLSCALSGIEIALWDIIGKALDQPIYNLLGGPVRPRLRLYANGWAEGNNPDAIANQALNIVSERGFEALKFDPFPGPWREYVNKEELDQAALIVRRVREAVGPKIDLLIEAHRRFSASNAVYAIKQMEMLNIYWFEEPCPPDNLKAIKEVKDSTFVPIVTGEAIYSITGFRDVIQERVVDIINPDICNTGGILEITQIAAMAHSQYIGVAPHGWNSTSVGLAAAVQASLTMPNFLIYEYMVSVEKPSKDITIGYLEPEGSYLEMPKGSGLGLTVDETKLRKHPYIKFPPRPIRTLSDETTFP
ncbi:mandelate racemase/muconate lactonizing enzyme family protein [Dehalococcoidia bacterium]|nr:mandelate racemase/muconate lactonizing enzyme family protein [Dehalococcoidia bacterium]